MRDYHIYKIIFECKTTKKVAARSLRLEVPYYPTILSPTIERIKVLRKNTLQKVAGS